MREGDHAHWWPCPPLHTEEGRLGLQILAPMNVRSSCVALVASSSHFKGASSCFRPIQIILLVGCPALIQTTTPHPLRAHSHDLQLPRYEVRCRPENQVESKEIGANYNLCAAFARNDRLQVQSWTRRPDFWQV